MKVKLNPVFAVYGPVGHPEAGVKEQGSNKDELAGQYHRYLAHFSIQGIVPSMFFNEDMSLEEQGYHVLPVINGEIDDEVIAKLPVPRCYQPAAAGEPGRKIAELTSFLPSYNNPDEVEVWNEGTLPEGSTSPCDHDFGLESYVVVFRHESGVVYQEDESYDFREGEYFNLMTCTRCGAVHAMNQKN